MSTNTGKSELISKLHEEIALKNRVSVDGIAVDATIFDTLDLGGKYQEQVHTLFEMDHEHHGTTLFPTGFKGPLGFRFPFHYDSRSDFNIILDGGQYILREKKRELFPVTFHDRPKYYSRKTSDGTPMRTVAAYGREGSINIAYSNECALKEKGEDCLFCNANATKDAYADNEQINWKNPRQIGETVKQAFSEGSKHVNLTGGFVPERREVDYYLDVAEAIQNETGLEDFNGTAVIGAPRDLSIIDRYKEAGFRTIAMNIETWDKNYFNTICPGKVTHCGPWEHWIKAIEYATKVFGYGKVRSGIVAGIEPKAKTLEGVNYFASIGVISIGGAWCPNPGSKLEGHRTPWPEWHLDMAYNCFSIAKKAGFTFNHFYDVVPASDFLVMDLFRIDEERLPVFENYKNQTDNKGE